MSNMESLPQLEIPRVEKTGYAMKHGELAVSSEVAIEYPEEQVFSE
jgi:hypothetical protein